MVWGPRPLRLRCRGPKGCKDSLRTLATWGELRFVRGRDGERDEQVTETNEGSRGSGAGGARDEVGRSDRTRQQATARAATVDANPRQTRAGKRRRRAASRTRQGSTAGRGPPHALVEGPSQGARASATNGLPEKWRHLTSSDLDDRQRRDPRSRVDQNRTAVARKQGGDDGRKGWKGEEESAGGPRACGGAGRASSRACRAQSVARMGGLRVCERATGIAMGGAKTMAVEQKRSAGGGGKDG